MNITAFIVFYKQGVAEPGKNIEIKNYLFSND